MTLKWSTEVKVQRFDPKIGYESNLVFLGSCFSDNISQRLKKRKLNVYANPLGTIYNPYSILSLLRLFLGHISIDDKDFIETRSRWYSWFANTEFFADNLAKIKSTIEQIAKEGYEKLKCADYLFLTFGTAWVYRYKATQRIVANCHKINDKEFSRFRLSVCDITDEYDMLLKSLFELNPKLKIVFTVSPIRHWKDGAIENHLSKSILTVAIHQLVDIYESSLFYFPAYEIVMDELRDYRFYTPDLIHLSNQTIDYIYEKFTQAFFDQKSLEIHSEIIKIHQTLDHEPIHPSDENYKKLCQKVGSEIQKIMQKVPGTNWDDEIQKINRIVGR
ncbi:MAG TPA: GSCFA domain-containing protein [Salinivirgaceae bacterium]|nr:GSCFA domain-containing protein [Salinivirgaceae bacterium]